MSELEPAVSSPTARRDRLIVLGLILLTLACYWPVGTCGFINYDDPKYITNNPDAQRGLTLENIKYAFVTIDAGYRHPFAWLTHLVDVELYGPMRGGQPIVARMLGTTDAIPAGHHLTNLLFHLIDTVLLWYVLKRLTGSVWASAWVAAMFSVHPMHVESVAWISERKDVLSTLFFLLTILAYKRYVERPGAARYGVVALAFIAALLSKPMMVTTPCVLLLLDVWPLNRISLDANFFRSLGRPALEKLPMLVLSAVSIAVSIRDASSNHAVYSLAEIPLSMRMEISILAYARYLGKLVWPTNLSIFYPIPPSWPMAWVAGATVLFILITAAVLWQAKKRPYLPIGWFWFAGVLVPVIGLVLSGDASLADRYTYVSYIGLFIAAAWLLSSLLAAYRNVLIGLAVVSIVACAGVTYRQIWNWRDSKTIMAQAIRATPDNWTADVNYGIALVEDQQESLAGPYLKEAVRIRPQSVLTNANYAGFLLNRNRIDEAAQYLLAAHKINPKDPFFLTQLGRLQAMSGKHEMAISNLKLALEIAPHEVQAEILLADSLMALGRFEEAEAHLRHVIDIKPTLAIAYWRLGKLEASQNHAAQAVANFRRTIELDPLYGQGHLDYGVTLARLGQYDAALEQLTLATTTLKDIDLQEQSHAEAMIGQLLETAGQPPEAAKKHYVASVDLAQKAVAAMPNEPVTHYELSLRLKKVGRNDEALAEARNAMAVAKAKGNVYFQGELAREFPSLATTRPTSRPATLPVQNPK